MLDQTNSDYKMRVAVIGSRSFNDYKALKERLDQFPVDVIVSGGARGADSLAERYAMEHNKELLVFPAEWNKFGKRAGFIRNKDIIDNCDFVIAFWDGSSNGTRHSLTYASSIGKPLLVFVYSRDGAIVEYNFKS